MENKLENAEKSANSYTHNPAKLLKDGRGFVLNRKTILICLSNETLSLSPTRRHPRAIQPAAFPGLRCDYFK